MSLHFRIRNPTLPITTRSNPLFSLLHPSTYQTKPNLSKTLTPTMAAEPYTKRATCHFCSKPSRLCLCARIKYPNFNNSIAVTVLQHTLEQDHPLNSTRIAALGLKNLEIVPVSDVHVEARFALRPIWSESVMGIDCFNKMGNGFKEIMVFENSALELKNLNVVPISDVDFEPQIAISSTQSDLEMGLDCSEEMNNGSNEKSDLERRLITFSISKNGVSPDFDLIFGSPKVRNTLAKGFVVKKWQRKIANESTRREEFKEFEIVVPPGSALLFPSDNSVGMEAINFEVKNLIVLDGTWSKAKRIYSENPWLRVLPHLRLDLDKMSLYSEVRRQPRAGYLSTIESIVYAMKGLGDESDGLCNLLEVFESMVRDQRRCKDERLSKISIE